MESRAPLRPGDRAPDFSLPALHRDGTVSLADYRDRSPVLVALFRGLYCPFCRRAVARMSLAAETLRDEGVESLAVVATTADNARLYFRFHPPRMSVAADPEFATHRSYGVPAPWRADIQEVFRATRVNPTGELPESLPIPEASSALSRLDGFAPTPTDREDAARPFLQLLGQFLIDGDGIIRWTNVECAREGLVGLGQFPSEQVLIAAARAVMR
ncbi:MAG: peroxiredoxin-like family protein [Candidatus Rokuibacteriota bacterium]